MRAGVGGGRCVIQCCSGDIFFRATNFFVLMTIEDSSLSGQSASGLNFYDQKPLFRHFSVRSWTKNSASGMTMTPLVYLMRMPSYGFTDGIVNSSIVC